MFRASDGHGRGPSGRLPGLSDLLKVQFERQPLLAPQAELVYERLGLLGKGGMGEVFRIRDRRLGREAALKILDAVNAPAELLQRFLREGRIMARLNHPGIPPIFEFGETPSGEAFIVMPLIRGRTLRAVIAEARTTHDGLMALLIKVAEALAYAHSRGVVHRDLKPENIMVGEHGEVQVIDWGLARDFSETETADARLVGFVTRSDGLDQGLTAEGAVLGTAGYMPPEQASGQPVDARADVFALGVILCELLTGRRPIDGQGSLQLLSATIAGRIKSPRALLASVSSAYEELAAAALSFDPQGRPPDAAAFLSALRSAAEKPPRRSSRAALPAALAAAALAFALGLAWRKEASPLTAPKPPAPIPEAQSPAPPRPRPPLAWRENGLGLALTAALQEGLSKPRHRHLRRGLGDAYFKLGELYGRQGRWDAAREVYKELMKLRGEDARFLALSGRAELKRREASGQLDRPPPQELERAIRRDDRDAIAHFFLAQAQSFAGEPALARAALETALARAPEDEELALGARELEERWSDGENRIVDLPPSALGLGGDWPADKRARFERVDRLRELELKTLAVEAIDALIADGIAGAKLTELRKDLDRERERTRDKTVIPEDLAPADAFELRLKHAELWRARGWRLEALKSLKKAHEETLGRDVVGRIREECKALLPILESQASWNWACGALTPLVDTEIVNPALYIRRGRAYCFRGMDHPKDQKPDSDQLDNALNDLKKALVILESRREDRRPDLQAEARLWLSYAHLGQGNLELARRELSAASPRELDDALRLERALIEELLTEAINRR